MGTVKVDSKPQRGSGVQASAKKSKLPTATRPGSSVTKNRVRSGSIEPISRVSAGKKLEYLCYTKVQSVTSVDRRVPNFFIT